MECKLIGSFVQHLEVTLSPGEEFYAERGGMLYYERGIEKEVAVNGRGLGSIIGAKISGESLFIVRYFNRSGEPKKLVLGGHHCLVPVKISNEDIICHRGVYVASNKRVNVSSKFSISGMLSGMGLLLQKISGSSTVFLDSNGSPIVIDLKHGETVYLDEESIVAIQGIPESRMNAEWSLSNFFAGEGISLLNVTGPGRVYLSPGKFPQPLSIKE